VRADKRLSEAARVKLREEILSAEGNEVFALGFLGSAGLVADLRVLARGNASTVPAPGSYVDSGADVLIHNHPSGVLSPSDNDLAIASGAAAEGIGSFIVNNDVTRVYVVAEPIPKKQKQALDGEAIVGALEPGGAIADRLAYYESRPAQIDLMRLLIQGFDQDAVVCAEAGTGVGKSFAYLVPAMEYALRNDARIVVSTATITLQQQLFDKDIPLVASALKQPVKAVLMKGRSNYVCLRRLADALRERDLDEAETEALSAIAAWTETTATGSRSDIPFGIDEAVWSRVCSEPDLCLGLRCPQRERCFVLALRREAADARLLVVNHHLLFADLAARNEGAGYDSTVVLPPYDRVILDEAHTIDGAATSFFSEDFSRPGLYRQLGRLYRKRRTQVSGLLLRLATLTGATDRLDPAAEALYRVREQVEALDATALMLMDAESVFRLRPDKDALFRAALLPAMGELRIRVAQLAGLTRQLLEEVPEAGEDDPAVWETKAALRRIEAAGTVCSGFMEYAERPADVFWLERHRGSAGDAWVRYAVTPVDVAPSLRDALFTPNKTVACVSATLTVADSFRFWSQKSGLGLLGERPVLTGQFPSPFPYAQAVLLASPTDAPLPDESGYQSFVDDAVRRLVEVSGGSALVLFTSYEALRSAWSAAAPALEAQGIRCLKQGDDDRSRLLQTFLKDESSALFATDSFWEGVDAPGDTLRLVILSRLPFRTPNDPVFEARRETLERKGGNAFMDLSLPEAVMKLKQGFGRLMRRSTDHGVVVVLDGRLLRKRYGSLFLRSLPETKRCFDEFGAVLRAVETFLYP